MPFPNQPKKDNKLNILDQDCERPACDGIQDALSKSMVALENKKKKEGSIQGKPQCPPRSAELGNSSWKLLHSMAAWYPEKPTMDQREKMNGFMHALAEFYPCTWCAQDFREEIKKKPPATESRSDLCMWLCEQHNTVNEKLGKSLFQCNMKNLDERWRKSTNESCQSDH